MNLNNERIIWHDEKTHGIIHKKVIQTRKITNYRVSINDSEIFLKDIDDIVVLNQHRVSHSSYTGTSYGRYTRAGFGNSSHDSQTIGDVAFIYHGQPQIIFRQIGDPHGVVKLAMLAKKTILAEQNEERISRKFYSPDLKWKLKSPMVDLNLIDHPEYDIELNEFPGKDYNKMVIHPLQAGNCIEFRNKKNKNYSGYLLESKNLVAAPRILPKEKNVQLLELTVEVDKTLRLLVSVQDKFAQEIIDKIQKLRQLENSNFWTKSNLTYSTDNGQKKTVEIFPLVPFLADDEEIIWYNMETGKGESNNKTVKLLQAITKFRIFEHNYYTTMSKMMLLSDLKEPIIMNQKTKTFGTASIGTLTRTRQPISDVEANNMSSKTVGDVVFMKEGKPFITFSQVSKPDEVVRVAQDTKAQIFPLPRNLNKTSKSKIITCLHCNTVNPAGAKFCNMCSSKLSSSCSKCGNDNPDGTAFCNECGFALA
jgi:Double zinc ribbon